MNNFRIRKTLSLFYRTIFENNRRFVNVAQKKSEKKFDKLFNIIKKTT